MERKRRGIGALIALPIIIASVEFSNIARNPRFEQIHNVDIVGLMGVGVCIGVAMSGFAMMIALRNRGASSPTAD
jgi:hypothetical protein